MDSCCSRSACIQGIARIFSLGGGGGLSDFFREMFASSRQTGMYQ